MKSNLVRRVLSISVVVASTMIGLAGTAHATRSVPPPKTEEVRSPMSVTLSMETFNQRMATIPEISGLERIPEWPTRSPFDFAHKNALRSGCLVVYQLGIRSKEG